MRVVIALALGVGVLPFAPLAAAAAGSPPTASLVAPAAGASSVADPVSLQVRPTDADDTSLDVTFHAAARTAGSPNSSAPFTFAVIPDTQNYVSTAANAPIMGAQTQWLVDHRNDLNLAFVTGLGDIVDDMTAEPQWQRASQYLGVLDSSGVPNTVLPGNHDLDLATGAAPAYRRYFPPSRYSTAGWNSPTASYGGYLGQNQFGPDPIDRQNMDNYALFRAGGMDFLLLNLEFNAPDYVVDWATRVLSAYPNRRAIVATHSYVDFTGALTPQVDRADGGNSGQSLFTKLIAPNCSIFLVVNGHFHSGNLSEARRTDTNSCGNPVSSILSDYQERANGGDGWLRYYTFVPAANEIRAFTYSPTLGQSETDSDSQFIIPYDMTIAAELPALGSGTVTSGTVATSPAPTVPPGTTVDWYVTVSDGTTAYRSLTWSYRTAAAGPSVLAGDAFGRSLTGGWGNADVGGSWALLGGNSRFSVADGVGKQLVGPSVLVSSALGGLGTTGVDLRTSLSPDRLLGTQYLTVSARTVGAEDYGARVKLFDNGLVQFHIMRTGTILTGGNISGITAVAGLKMRVRVQVEGVSPTTIRAKLWKDGIAEPASWMYTATDSTPSLQAFGGVRLETYVSGGASGQTATVRWDDLSATTLGTSINQPPIASFNATMADLTASVDSGASADPDGSITARTWNFGDGGTASGITATHTYAAAGTYQVTLTVTDNAGTTATATRQVAVSTPAPNQPPKAVLNASVNQLTVNVDGTGSSDPDGSVTAWQWQFGDGSTGTGPTTSHTYAAAGVYAVVLTVADNRGANASITKQVTVSAPPGPGILGADAFGRNVINGWESADTGGAWTITGTSSGTSVSNGAGIFQVPSAATVSSSLKSVNAVGTDLKVTLSLDRIPNGTVYNTVSGRVIGSADYGAEFKVYANGSVQLYLDRSGTSLVGGVLPGVVAAAGTKLNLRLQVQGTAPTTLRAKVWPSAGAEPTSWQYTTTDSTAGLQGPGSPRLSTYLSSSATNGPVIVRWDDLTIGQLN